MAIQDTRDQDIRIEPAQLKGVRNRKRALQIAAAIAVLAAAVWLTFAWLSGGRTISKDRVRIATVTPYSMSGSMASRKLSSCRDVVSV